MLSDHEREALRELERQFTADSGAAAPVPHRVGRQQFGASGTLLIGAMLFLGVLMLMAGSLTGALIFDTMAWLIWWAWSASNEDTQQPP